MAKLEGCIIIICLLGICIGKEQSTNVTDAIIPNGYGKILDLDEKFNLQLPGSKINDAFNWMKSLFNGEDSFVGRCIHAARRLKAIMPFIIFKLGVIVTTLGFLTIISLKGLAIGVILLVINAAGLFGKAAYLKGQHHHYPEYHPPPHSQAIHVHVHKEHDAHHHAHPHFSKYDYGSGPPTAWADRVSEGLKSTRSLAEKLELIQLYKRLGFDVNSALRRDGSQFLRHHADVLKDLKV